MEIVEEDYDTLLMEGLKKEPGVYVDKFFEIVRKRRPIEKILKPLKMKSSTIVRVYSYCDAKANLSE